MRISRIQISGYRSIDGPIEIHLANICALIGPNNCGKSNILHLINSILGKSWVSKTNFDEDDVHLRISDTDICVTVDFDEPYKYRSFKHTEEHEIPRIKFSYTRYKIGEHKGERRLEKDCLTLDDKPVRVLSAVPKSGQKNQYKVLTTIPQELLESIPLIYIGSERQLKYQLPAARNSLLGILLDDINADFMRSDNMMTVKKPDGEEVEIQRAARFTKAMAEAIRALKTEEFNNLESTIKKNTLEQLGFGQDTSEDDFDIYFQPPTSQEFYKALNLFVKESGFDMEATNLGGGFQNAIIMSIMRTFEQRKKEGAIILIEEPEMMLHPQMQRSLYKTIRKIGETNQVIYVTHSPQFVTIPEFDEIAIIRKEKNKTTITRSSLNNQAQLKEKFRKELDAERNELFFARKLLFVEGPTEKLALPEYAARMNLDFDQIGATIVEVGGKRNLPDFIDLALSFKIPTGFAYDVDSSDFSSTSDEASFNERLENYKDKVSVWSFDKNYEDELRNAFGETDYQTFCQRFPNSRKPTKARLIANDATIPVPTFVKAIVEWLGTTKTESA